MSDFDLLHTTTYNAFERFGYTSSYLEIHVETVLHTLVVLFLISIIVLPLKFILRNKKSMIRFVLISMTESFADFTAQTLGSFSFAHFSFIASLFIFIFLCNSLSIFPWLEEPTQDLNTAFALGIASFLYVQYYAIKTQGFLHYLKEYFEPFFIMFPLHIMGKLATVISISFRLFGNIFGGATITKLYFTKVIQQYVILEIVGLFSANILVTLFFGLFEGFLQAFVFSMLTLTYLSIAIHGESGEAQGTML